MGYSRWFLCDLQVHTPADQQHRYGDAGGREPNADFARRLVEAHREAGVEVIAVSDHNRIDWYAELRSAGEAVGVYVFPGLEFNVNKCHLLAVWDRTDEGYELAQRFLQSLWRPGEQAFENNGDPRPVGSGQVRDWAEKARDHRALLLAPHATQKEIGFLAKGVCTTRRDVIDADLIAAFDVWGNAGADVLANPASEFGSRVPAWFVSGDTRSLDEVGKRAVYLKLGTEPTLEGLRQAFLMPHTRVRFPTHLRESLSHTFGVTFLEDPEPTWPRITSAHIIGGFHDGLAVDFAPGLNAVIGGKGTGKSTLIEILRYVLAVGDAPPDGKSNRIHNFRANAEATVVFADPNGDVYHVHRTGSDDPPTLSRGGERLNVDIHRRVSVRVFGQRELQQLADQSEALRAFVASEVGGPWDNLSSNERETLADLNRKDAELTTLEADISQLAEDESELADIDDRLANANAANAADLIDRLDGLGKAADDVSEALAWPGTVQAKSTSIDISPPSVPELVRARDVINAALGTLADKVRSATKEIGEAAETAETELTPAAQAWAEQQEKEQAEIEAKLAEVGVTDARQLAQMQGRARELRSRISSLPGKRDRAKELELQRVELLDELGKTRRAKSRVIEEAARSLSERVGPRVRVRVEPFADRHFLLEELERAVAGQGVRADQLNRLAEQHSPMTIAKAITRGTGEVETLGCSASTASKLASVSLADVRKIEETDTPDRILVEVNLSDEPEKVWSDVAEVSPGQRAMALLALALTGGTDPLIIDQPEDDLDNRYIYDEVVRVIADTCSKRQVIVATHNANIPILGDADLVLALDAEASKGRVLACGGLEEPQVAEYARHILEGGDAAFQARHRRYQAARLSAKRPTAP